MKVLLLALALSLTSASAVAQNEASESESESPFATLDWRHGPGSENIASKATIKTAEGLSFLDERNSRLFLEMTGNLPEDGNYVIVPDEGDWWGAFAFEDMGYVKDDEKIDADELLATMKASDAPSNEERRRLGLSELHTIGWSVPPHYDTETKQLEWGLKVSSDGHEVVNYTVRLLGRTGVMNAVLVADVETLDSDVKAFKSALAGFSFNNGERYAEYREGDRVAEYGLAALVVGGAAAVAAKTGFLAKFWKLIVLGGAGLFAFIGKLLGRNKKI